MGNKKELNKFIRETRTSHLTMGKGRGIVFVAGGDVYFLNAFINIQLLRENGCTLPIEWFYLGSNDMTDKQLSIIKRLEGVTVIDLSDKMVPMGTSDFSKSGGGWQAKTKAIMNSSFAEILYLDADSFPQINPEYLFNGTGYQRCGHFFTPDTKLTIWNKQSEWKILDEHFGVLFNKPTLRLESGQMLINKTKCWKGLLIADYHNQNPETYEIVKGDKDTFLFGFLKAGYEMNIAKKDVMFESGIFYQNDENGDPLFHHLIGKKFRFENHRPQLKNRMQNFDLIQKSIEYLENELNK